MNYTAKIVLTIIIGILFQTDNLYSQAETTASGMQWYSLEEAQAKAKEEGKKVLIFGYADWCTYCRKMRKEVYPDTAVQHTLYDYYYPVQLDVESETPLVFNGREIKEKELAQRLRLTSLPTHYFVDQNGEILGAQPGYFPEDVFEPLLRYVGSDSFGRMKFEQFIEEKE